jgi:Uncharacterized small protein (DUF2158).
MLSGYRTGQTVRLASGGPTMTVGRVYGDSVECFWFEGAQLREATFESGVLSPPLDNADDDLQTYTVDNFG